MDEDLALGWRFHAAKLMSDHGPVGTRPWGWWWFEVTEAMPDDWGAHAIRLAELGELRADELAALRERANEAKLRVGTARERVSGGWLPEGVSMNARAVELFEAVRTAAGGTPS